MNDLQIFKAVYMAKCYNGPKILPKDVSIFCGYGRLSFKPVKVTLYDVAKLIRFTCWTKEGDAHKERLNTIKRVKEKFIIMEYNSLK